MLDPDNDLPPVLEQTSALPLPSAALSTSLFARLLNIFAIPGQVFEEVRTSRYAVGNWLAPTFLCALALTVSALVILSMPSVAKQLVERQFQFRTSQATALGELVKAGKVTPTDADKALALLDSLWRPAVIQPLAMMGGFILGMLRVFWWAFVLWLLARVFLKFPLRFDKALEVAGLASMIALLSTVALLVLTVNLGKSFSPAGFALAVTDVQSSGWQMLALGLNLLNFWFVGVLGAGLARLTGAPLFRGIFLVFGYWLAMEFLMLLLGFGSVG